jgi:hypothetical protein
MVIQIICIFERRQVFHKLTLSSPSRNALLINKQKENCNGSQYKNNKIQG